MGHGHVGTVIISIIHLYALYVVYNPQFDLSIGTCLECYEKENGSYYKNCAICGIQITPHNSALLTRSMGMF